MHPPDTSITWKKPDGGLEVKLAIRSVKLHAKTAIHEVTLVDTLSFGLGLFLNGYPQTFDSDEVTYHQALVHPAILSHPAPRSVLLVGCAEGCALREICAHRDIQSVTMVDLDIELIEIAKQQLRSWHRDSFSDPRVRVIGGDILQVLPTLGTFDVIILALDDPLSGGRSTETFSNRFFHLIAEHMAPRGRLCAQCGEVDYNDPSGVLDIFARIKSAFRHVTPLVESVPSYFADWSFALSSQEPLSIKDLFSRLSTQSSCGFSEGAMRSLLSRHRKLGAVFEAYPEGVE